MHKSDLRSLHIGVQKKHGAEKLAAKLLPTTPPLFEYISYQQLKPLKDEFCACLAFLLARLSSDVDNVDIVRDMCGPFCCPMAYWHSSPICSGLSRIIEPL